jgi:hypothetical protein
MVTVQSRPYTQQRLVQLFLPLVLLVAAAGWDGLWRFARARERRDRAVAAAPAARPRRVRASTAVAAVGLLGAGAYVATNGYVIDAMDLTEQAEVRHVGPEFAEAAGWLGRVGGSEGERAAVLVGDFFSQLWITDALRDQPGISYPALYPSYQYQDSYWNESPRRWLLVDRDAMVRATDGVVVRENERFALLDLSRGRAVVAVPADVFGQNSYMVMSSSRGPGSVKLVGLTRPRVVTDVPPLDGYGDPVPPGGLDPGTNHVRFDLEDGVSRRVVLSDDEDIFVLMRVRFG